MKFYSVSDKQLLDAWISGNEKAFEQLFNLYFPKLFRYAQKFISDKSACEEIVMDVMFRIWQNKNIINPERSFSSYLFTSITNKLIDHLRKEKVKTFSLDETYTIPSYSFIADSDLLRKEMDKMYSRGLSRLSPQRKRVFLMSRVDGKSYRQIASNLNLSIKTIENHMIASLSQLKKFVSKEQSN